jgi:hypothetical protein
VPNGGTKTITFEGNPYIFPSDATDAEISSTLTRHVAASTPGAMQAKPGGPVFNARTVAPQPAEGPASIGSVLREGALGASSAILPESAATTSGKQNLATIGRSLNEQVNKAATTPWGQGGPLYGTLAMIANSILGAAKGAGSGALELGKGVLNTDPQQAAHGGGSFLGNLATLGLMKKSPEVLEDPLGKAGLREVMGEGASKVKVLSDLHEHAIETQKHIAGVADAVNTDAQNAMSRVSQAVDAAKPEGAFDKGEVSSRLKTAMADVQLADQSQLPKSVQKLITTEKPTFEGLANEKIQGLVSRFRKVGLSDNDITQTLKEQGFAAKDINAALGNQGPVPGRMSFEELKQARSDLGRVKDRLQGPANAVANTAYGELSKMLRETARDAGQEPDWIDANARYKNYMDDFSRSPLKHTLEGENAHDIMDPLTGKSRIQVAQILQKYTPFGLDLDKINQEVRRSGLGETVTKLSRPTKMDLLMAGFSPKALAVRQLGPRIMRNPSVLSFITGEGFKPENIPPSKVYPSAKVAAAAELKGGGSEPSGGVSSGGPTPFTPPHPEYDVSPPGSPARAVIDNFAKSGDLASLKKLYEKALQVGDMQDAKYAQQKLDSLKGGGGGGGADWTEEVRRRAPGKSPVTKSVERHYNRKRD